MNRKPRVFIGSSIESLNIANAINENLDHTAEVTIWKNGTFFLSSSTIDSLVQKASSIDFAVFIFSPDDIITIRETQTKSTRDNVIFELGLFIGTIGKERCFIVKPRNTELHLPSDLLGLTTADFETNRSDGDLGAALNLASILIKKEIDNKGLIDNVKTVKKQESSFDKVNQKIYDSDLKILSYLLTSITENPNGQSAWEIKNSLKLGATKTDISIIKLERYNLLEKINDTNFNGEEFYSYKLTTEGVDFVLVNEDEIYKLEKPIRDIKDI